MNERLSPTWEDIFSNNIGVKQGNSKPLLWKLDTCHYHVTAVESRYIASRRVMFVEIVSRDGGQQWIGLEGDVDFKLEETGWCIFCGKALPNWSNFSLSTREKLGLWSLSCKNCIKDDIFKPCIACEAGIIDKIVRKGMSPASIQEAKEVVQWSTCKKILRGASINVSSLRCLKNHVLILKYHDRADGSLLEWNVLVEGEWENEINDGTAMACMVIKSKDIIVDIFSILELVLDLENAIEPRFISSKTITITREGGFTMEERLSELRRYNDMLAMQGHHVDEMLGLNHVQAPLRAIDRRKMVLGSRTCKMFRASSMSFQVFSWITREIEEYNKKHPFQFEVQLHLPMNLEPCLFFQEHVIPKKLGRKLEGKIVHSWGKWAILEKDEGHDSSLHAIDLRELVGKRIEYIVK